VVYLEIMSLCFFKYTEKSFGTTVVIALNSTQYRTMYNLRERDHWGDPGVVGRIILGWIFRKWDVGVWIGLGWLRIETVGEQL
jgi:hypothetical protein